MADEGEVDCGHEFPAHYKVMLDKLNEQRQLDQFTDITLIVDGHQFRAHKAVLAACSQFFHNFFQDFTQEPLVEIEGVSNLAFQHLMEFTYTATLSVHGTEEVSDVWRAAEYLQMQEAIKALNNRLNGAESLDPAQVLRKNKAKKRKIAETSNVITETLPSVTETVEIEVEVGGGAIDMEEAQLEEVVDAARNAQAASDESALALLADITSKYQQGGPRLQAGKKDQETVGGEEEEEEEEEMGLQEETVEGIEVVEVQVSHLQNLFRCDKCERCFKLFYHLKQHMKTHETAATDGGRNKSYVCQHCNRPFAREGALKHHISTQHYEAEEQSGRLRPQKKVHVCEYCDKQFDHFGHFKEHLRKHTGEKPFECPDCHERFARNSTLKCHMAACQNGCGAKKGRKKLYECQVCNSVFNSWDQFKDHLVTHTGDKPNHCTFCDLWFTQPRDLKVHLRDIHGIQEKMVITAASDEEVVIAESVATEEAEEGLILATEAEMRVEHITVEPVDMVAVDEALLVEDAPHPDPGSARAVEEGSRTVVYEEVELEKLKEPEGVELQVEHVTVAGEPTDTELQVEEESLKVETAEIEVEGM
uniref:Zinc finger protein 131 n=1 Tax=Denticeps clupeoides TaxID=299321 RepID=A0AAY4AQL7_9TELE